MKFYKVFVRRSFLLLALFFCSFFSNSSQAQGDNFWINAGFSLEIGTPIRRVGGFLRSYYIYQQFQFNAEARLYYQISTFGPSKKGWEWQTGVGTVFFWGKAEENWRNPFFSLVSQQAKHPYSVGYAYQYYLDEQETSQATGTIAFQVSDFQVAIENDLLGRFGEDKYRTATFLVQYQDTLQQIGVKSILWTGSTFGAEHGKNPNYPARSGYWDMENAKFGNFSHGILGTYYHYFWENQVIGGSIGLDDERVRHALQNRFIHDLFFIPKKWNNIENRHVPMVDTEGKSYIFLEDQKIRKTKPYFQFSVNPTLFY